MNFNYGNYPITGLTASPNPAGNQNVFDAAYPPGAPTTGNWSNDPSTLTARGADGSRAAYAGNTFAGPLSTGSTGNTAYYNQIMMRLSEHFEPFLQRKLLEQPKFWYDLIPRSAYPLYSGFVRETRIYRGGMVQYAGLDNWEAINPIPSGTNDPCAPLGFKTFPYGWERLEWTGMRTAWGSDPICLEDFLYTDEAITQLGWILDSGAEQGIAIQEVWNRDNLIRFACQQDRGYLMSRTYVGNSSPARFYYDPMVKFVAGAVPNPGGRAAKTVYNDAAATAPFIVFPADTEIEPLNFDALEQLRKELAVMAADGAVTKVNGQNVFGLAVSMDDFEKYISGNERERGVWLRGAPVDLIQGIDYGVTEFRRWAIMSDDNQLRFKIKAYIAAYDSAVYGGVGAQLDGQAVWVAQYVPPRRRAPRVGENNSFIPESNPDYHVAELAVSPIFMGKIYENQFVTPPNSLGSGTFFGPQTGLNGIWQWLNIQTVDNPLQTKGNFYGQFRIFPKPNPNIFYATAMLYRRCANALRSQCPIQNYNINPDAGYNNTDGSAGMTSLDLGFTVTDFNSAIDLTPTGGTEIAATKALIDGYNAASSLNALTITIKGASTNLAPGVAARTLILGNTTMTPALVVDTVAAPKIGMLVGGLTKPSEAVTNAAATGYCYCNDSTQGPTKLGKLCSWDQVAGADDSPGPATVGAVTWTVVVLDATHDKLLV
jgi:hypothetical protein